MPSIHVKRWVENLKDTTFELYWYDITNQGSLGEYQNVVEFENGSKRKRPHIKGEYFLSKKMPFAYEYIRPFLEVTEAEVLEGLINTIKPDLVHSFEMQHCSYPILKTMNKFPEIKWLYSCWGSDLFFFQKKTLHRKKIKSVLKRIDYLHTDCNRDYTLAKHLGFKGIFTDVIPGGGGYDLNLIQKFKVPASNRNIILVKGYQHGFGRAMIVLKALEILEKTKELDSFQVVVFGVHREVADYIKSKELPFSYYRRDELSNLDLLELMGKALVYIGNSISDGMPNTLLEAMVMGAFPIQSNPGGVSREIITEGVNGFLIENPENQLEIERKISESLKDFNRIQNAFLINAKITEQRLEYSICNEKIVNIYKLIEAEKNNPNNLC